VTASVKEGMIVTEVADRGPGIPRGEEQRIFEKFYQLHPDREGGVGLGLTICRGIIESHGGRIWVEARSGGGSSFSLHASDRAQSADGRTGTERA
jgi:two-component system sensor histidine kinase KdpD